MPTGYAEIIYYMEMTWYYLLGGEIDGAEAQAAAAHVPRDPALTPPLLSHRGRQLSRGGSYGSAGNPYGASAPAPSPPPLSGVSCIDGDLGFNGALADLDFADESCSTFLYTMRPHTSAR